MWHTGRQTNTQTLGVLKSLDQKILGLKRDINIEVRFTNLTGQYQAMRERDDELVNCIKNLN